MSTVYLYILLASLLTSLLSFVGVLFLSFSLKKLKKILMLLVSFSAGTLLGDAFLHLLPEAVENMENSMNLWFGVLLGIIIFFSLEKFIHWRHCHETDCQNHPQTLGLMNLVGDALHNFIDGMIIAASFLIDVRLGVITTIAIISHEIPQEIGDFGVLIHSGFKVKKVLLFNFLSALFSVLGALLLIIIGDRFEGLIDFIIPLTAGGFIYIASSDLIPELKKDARPSKTLKQLLCIFLGIGLMFLLKIFFE